MINIANPLECYQNPGVRAWRFRFGAYGDIEVYVFGSSLEKAIEDAAWFLRDNSPGVFTEENILPHDDDGNPVDHTYTEAGWIPSWEWWVEETNADDLADKALALLSEEGRIDDPTFNRDDIMLAWWHYLKRHQGDDWSSPNHLRLLRLEDHFQPYGLSVTLTGIHNTNAAAIYGRLAAGENNE
jgi:hypothetical protein